jgi:hypothetical protein
MPVVLVLALNNGTSVHKCFVHRHLFQAAELITQRNSLTIDLPVGPALVASPV